MQRLQRADLHVHSRYSNKPSSWALRKFNCPESFTKPEYIYQSARRKGMDYVTITDHNSIEGALEIANLPNAFISMETNTYLPENGCKLHVVALGITEADYQEIMRLRKNIYELSAFLRERKITHFPAHPLYDMNGRLTADVFEKLILLFDVFEVKNGSRSKKYNSIIELTLASLTKEKIEFLANKHDIDPVGAVPWRKAEVAGSDDHSGLFVARAYTASRRGDNIREFLDAVTEGECWAAGEDGDAFTLAHSIYGVGYKFFKEKIQQNRSGSFPFVHRLLRTVSDVEGGGAPLFEKIKLFIHRYLPEVYDEAHEGRSFEQVLDTEARRILRDTKFLASISANDINRKAFVLVSRLINKLMYIYTKRLTKAWPPTGIAGLFNSMGTIGLLHILTSPYYLAFHHQNRSKKLIREVKKRFAIADEQPRKIALFTDTLHEINGVAITIKRMIGTAKAKGIELVVITSDPNETKFADGLMSFQSVGEFTLPEYPELKLHFPPLLEVLDYFERERFTSIHASTPGTMGLMALFLSRILDVPISGTYHTDIPKYVKSLTNDTFMEEAAWQYMIWFYNLMAEVMVPSSSTRNELVERGLDPAKAKPLPRWVDTTVFSPTKKSPDLWRAYGLDASPKLLYVGRVSKEKNLELLARSFASLVKDGVRAHLVVVGDGPFRAEMERLLKGYPAYFTGFKTGEELCALYASADVFVFPSATDTFGNVVLEAQASGLPAIVSDTGGPRELIVHGTTGFAVQNDNSESFMKAMRLFIDDPALRAEMGVRARLFTERKGLNPADYCCTILEGGVAAL